MSFDLIDVFKNWDKGHRSRLNDRDRRRILFDLPNAFSAKAAVPVALELIRRGHSVAFTGRDQRPGSEWSYLPLYPALRPHFIHRYVARWRSWDIVVFTDGPSADYLRWALKVRFPHGPGEGLYGSPHSLALVETWGYEVLLCTSEFNVKHIESLNPSFVSGKNLHAIGWPCLDELVNQPCDRAEVLRELALPVEQKTLLVTSHWTPASLLRVFGGAQIVERLAYLRGVNVILTAHNHLWYRDSVRRELGEAWYDKLDQAINVRANTRLVKTGDIRNLLSIADVMIGDRSSVTLEYSVLGRPILQYIQGDHAPSNQELDRLFSRTVHRFSSLADLAPLAESQLRHPSTGGDGVRAAFIDQCFSHLGAATGRAADVMEKL